MITADELCGLGLSLGEIRGRVERGELHRHYQGVFSIGVRRLTQRGMWLAAVRAMGEGALLSHEPALALAGVRRSSKARIDVTVPNRRRPRPGLVVHQAVVPDDERSEIDGIPCTTVARAILDCAPRHSTDSLKRMINQADVMHVHDRVPLIELLTRYPRRPGAPKLRSIFAQRGLGNGITKRELEAAFQVFLGEGRYPPGEANQYVQLLDGTWIEVDYVWRTQRVIVELDSREFHLNAEAFERDRERDLALAAAGWTVVRITWRRLHSDRAKLATELRAVLCTPR